MGKSDPYLLNFYKSMIKSKYYENIGFFGQSGENFLSQDLNSNSRKFYDLSLDNWNINDFPYEIDEKFDLIVCTRCAYFCKHPHELIKSFMKMLNPNGLILIDWGLGDHWRFEKYKVGWIKDSEHEYAYTEDNFLWSYVWHDSFINNAHVKTFENNIKKFGYDSELKKIIEKEVPHILDLQNVDAKVSINHLTLWSDKPQLYTCLLIKRN